MKSNLLRLVEERIQLKRDRDESKRPKKKEARDSLVPTPHLPEDCIFNIIVRLPLESLRTSQLICKSWYGIVHSPNFINAPLQRSDTGLIFLTLAKKDSSLAKADFLVESKAMDHGWPLIDTPPLYHINFMEIKDGKCTIKKYNTICTSKITTTCNGLVVLENPLKRGRGGGGLIILNPLTRELENIPLGTISLHDSYGLAFCQASRKYKLVHLFKDNLNYIECEIMEIGSGSWRAVEGPPNGYLSSLCNPVLALGALHWCPIVHRNEYMVSMALEDEKFKVIRVPKSGRGFNWVFAMGEFLGFSSCEEGKRMDVWVLRGLEGGWEKQYSIDVNGIRDVAPLFYYGRGKGELVFRDGETQIYVYDCHSQLIKKIEMVKECPDFSICICTHVNSRVSCRS